MRYAVVVSHRSGYAGLFVERAARPGATAELAAVVLCRGEMTSDQRRRHRRRKLRKALSIGLIGTLQGLRMRHWYGRDVHARLGNPDVVAAAERAGVPVVEIARFGDPDAQRVVRDLALDLGVSLGNGYIPRSFFTIPKLGMINVHHELLPAYRGAQTVLWQLHNGSLVTGFTVHEIDDRIDGGRILERVELPILLRPTLRETVVETSASVQRRSVERLLELLDEFECARARALPNEDGCTYTTPGTGALLRIYRNFRRMRNRGTKVIA